MQRVVTAAIRSGPDSGEEVLCTSQLGRKDRFCRPYALKGAPLFFCGVLSVGQQELSEVVADTGIVLARRPGHQFCAKEAKEVPRPTPGRWSRRPVPATVELRLKDTQACLQAHTTQLMAPAARLRTPRTSWRPCRPPPRRRTSPQRRGEPKPKRPPPPPEFSPHPCARLESDAPIGSTEGARTRR